MAGHTRRHARRAESIVPRPYRTHSRTVDRAIRCKRGRYRLTARRRARPSARLRTARGRFAVLRLLAQTAADRSAYRRLVRRLHFTAVVASVLESTDVREFSPGRSGTLAPARANASAVARANAFVPARSNALVRDALDIIERRYAENIGPAEIARELGRHPAYLTNLVREATGKSLGTWLIERRLGAARVLLSKTDDSVGDIAAAVGYVDGSHFARYFTRRYGAPPARWRRRRSA